MAGPPITKVVITGNTICTRFFLVALCLKSILTRIHASSPPQVFPLYIASQNRVSGSIPEFLFPGGFLLIEGLGF